MQKRNKTIKDWLQSTDALWAKYASDKMVDTHFEALLTIDRDRFFNKFLYDDFEKTFAKDLYGN